MTEKTDVAIPAETPRSLSEIAREVYGEEYKPDTEAPRSGAVDQAFRQLREERGAAIDAAEDERALAERAEAEPEVPAEIPDDDEVEPGARWSDQDVQTITLFQQEAAQFQQDLTAFAQAKRAGVDKLAAGDKAKAAALRTQMQEAERELTARYEVLQQVAGELQNKAATFAVRQAERHLAREKTKLHRALPDLDNTVLREYLMTDGGFTSNEVKQAFDHRLVVLAEKARRYDEGMAASTHTKVVPVLRRGAKPKTPERKSEPSVAELKDQLKKTGDIRVAYQLIGARRKAAA